jgi:hypothetical protein
MAVSMPRSPQALVVEADPTLWDLFKILLEKWELRFVRDPWAVSAKPAEPVDLLIVDEDPPAGCRPGLPEWLKRWQSELPSIVFRQGASSEQPAPSLLVLPKPFPVSLFLAFADTVRQKIEGSSRLER